MALTDVWTERSQGISPSRDLASIAHNDVVYLCNHVYPFLQLVNPDAVFSDEIEINFILTTDGWLIHDYGEAISCSIPLVDVEINAEEKKDTSPHKNRTFREQINTASEIANLVAKKGWQGAELIGGSQLMLRLFWIESKRYDLEFPGYTPTEDDEKCYEKVMKNAKDNGITWEKEKPKEEAAVTGLAWTSDETE